jgi:hypothetical protein
MQIAWGRLLPVIVSVLIIIAVALLRDRSRVFAVILATMPLNIPLTLWVVSSAETFEQIEFVTISQALIVGLLGTMAFAVVLYFTARAGWSFVPMLLAGYAGWGVTMGILYWIGWFRI